MRASNPIRRALFGHASVNSGVATLRTPRVLPWLRYDRWVQAVVATFVIAYAVSTFVVPRPTGYNTFWDLWIEDLAFVLPAVPMVLAARRWSSARVLWLSVAAGTVLNTIANLVYTLHDQNIVPFPSPAPSDYFYLASYAAIIVGIAVLTQGRLGAVHLSVRLDGLIMALALGSLAGALWFEPLLQASGRPAVVIVTLAYPLCDLIMLILLFAGLAPNRFKPDLQTWMFLLGVLWFVVGDVIYLREVNDTTYVTGTFLDATWVIGFWLMGIAASVPPRRGSRTRRHVAKSAAGSRGLITVPVASGLVSLGVIIMAFMRHDRSIVVLSLAAASLGAVIVRMWMTLREEGALVASSAIDARTDALTGLANRRSLLERIEALLTDEHGTTGVVLLDLDGFKDVNDALGHFAGDELLTALGRRLQHRFGQRGTVARLGGDEFAFTSVVASEEELVGIAHGLLETLDDPYVLDEVPLRVSASAGVALAPSDDPSAIDLLRGADVAMYEAKRSHVEVCVYQPTTDPNSRERLALLGDLRGAIETGALTLHFQPTLDLRTGDVRGIEALARWPHPEHGMLLPDVFIPVAERVGLMPKLTRLVLDQALTEAVRLDRAGHELQLSVNVSRYDLTDESLPDDLEGLLARHSFPASRLTLEITESAIGSDPTRTVAQVASLRAKGVRISIDDFGVGYSSMSQLRELTVDELKIDKSFIIGLCSDDRAQAIVHSSIELSGALGLSLVAEGIEDDAVLRTLERMGADVGQGYFIARPMPAAALGEFLDATRRTTGAAGSDLLLTR
jgi:diguanylate cyclase (GGDEF)-like protein